ncbi:MAG: hypothetical protein MUO17_03285 [Dehalococcoidales bacterium]|nr:hypothetical protein [Dehalococcoidales bacterium]
MKVTAKFIFQLPFALKMKEVRSIMPKPIKREGEEIIIYPPVHTKHDMTEKPFWQLKTPKPRKTQLDKLNCFVIDIRRDFQNFKQAEEASGELLLKAREILYQLLNLCRKREILHIGNINVEKLGYRRRFFDANGNILTATGQTNLTLPTPPFASSKWADICQDLASGNLPEIYEILILDAKNVVSSEPRRAVLDASTASEVFIKRFCKSKSRRESAIKSLWENKPELLKELDYLRRTNISVKHEGKCQYRNCEGELKQVDSQQACEFIKAVEDAMQYTKSLTC